MKQSEINAFARIKKRNHVSDYDFYKAFDGVWLGDLFHQLRQMGVTIIYRHETKWRNHFNAAKSPVLVYGESDYKPKSNAKLSVYHLVGSEI